MAAKKTEGPVSKNARLKGDKTQKNFCRCGQEIKMFSIMHGGRLVPTARCGAGHEARRPRDLKD